MLLPTPGDAWFVSGCRVDVIRGRPFNDCRRWLPQDQGSTESAQLAQWHPPVSSPLESPKPPKWNGRVLKGTRTDVIRIHPNDLAQTVVHLRFVRDGERTCNFGAHVPQIVICSGGSAERQQQPTSLNVRNNGILSNSTSW